MPRQTEAEQAALVEAMVHLYDDLKPLSHADKRERLVSEGLTNVPNPNGVGRWWRVLTAAGDPRVNGYPERIDYDDIDRDGVRATVTSVLLAQVRRIGSLLDVEPAACNWTAPMRTLMDLWGLRMPARPDPGGLPQYRGRSLTPEMVEQHVRVGPLIDGDQTINADAVDTTAESVDSAGDGDAVG